MVGWRVESKAKGFFHKLHLLTGSTHADEGEKFCLSKGTSQVVLLDEFGVEVPVHLSGLNLNLHVQGISFLDGHHNIPVNLAIDDGLQSSGLQIIAYHIVQKVIHVVGILEAFDSESNGTLESLQQFDTQNIPFIKSQTSF
jgi:hypothetical protein